MPEEDGGTATNRIWRLEQLVHDVLMRLDRIEQKLEKHEATQERNVWRITNMEDTSKLNGARLDTLDERVRTKGTSPLASLSDTTIKVVVYGLLAAVVALAGGQFARFLGVGIFGG